MPQDVFDEWGNKIGEFIPSGEGCGWAGCLLLIIIAILAITIGLPIYLLVKGGELWGEDKKDSAVACWMGALIVVVIYIFLYASIRSA
jgi:type IV secretory pathway TrbL component